MTSYMDTLYKLTGSVAHTAAIFAVTCATGILVTAYLAGAFITATFLVIPPVGWRILLVILVALYGFFWLIGKMWELR